MPNPFAMHCHSSYTSPLLKQLFTCPILVPTKGLVNGEQLILLLGTHHPSGIYLLTIKGIFFAANSLIAICKGSVAPSMSTRTGAFILSTQSVCMLLHRFSHPLAWSYTPNLQSPRAQNPSFLIFRHIWRSLPLIIWDLLDLRFLLSLCSRRSSSSL